MSIDDRPTAGTERARGALRPASLTAMATSSAPASRCSTRSSATAAHHPVPAAVVRGPFADLEDAGALPGPPLPGRHLRRAGERPLRPAAGAGSYIAAEYAADALAVLDATGTDRAVVVSLSRGASYALHLAAARPERVAGQIFICPTTPLAPFSPARLPFARRFEEALDSDEGWAKDNAHYWLRDYPGFLEFFFSQVFTEPHSTKQIEDGVGWGLETAPETLADTGAGRSATRSGDISPLCRAVRCPCLVIQGTDDAIVGARRRPELAAALGARARLVELAGSGHSPHARDPVKVNLLLREFIEAAGPPSAGPPSATAARLAPRRGRAKRVLYISSPIGLGHARRDVAIAGELRRLRPGLQIDWLAQHPVTAVLEARGERIHPASRALASESGHIESECADHDLHCFQAWRRMDEILLANFMVFHDIVRDDPYDLWIGDEAWELDYYLHENPAQKRAAYVWLTDFVGWLPMPDGGQREASLTADYNAEMIGHIARYPRLRDRAIFVGAPEDIVPDSFGPGLPGIRQWTEAHYDFSGDYITGFDPSDLADRDALRAELGYAAGEKVCVVTVGGSGVGAHLLRRVIEAYPQAKRAVPGLRMVAVAGPRIDPRGCRPCPASRCTRTSTTCTAIWPPATWPSSRAGSPRPWSSSPATGRSSTSRSATTSSRPSTSPTGSPATAPGGAWTTRPPAPRPSARRSPGRSGARSGTARWIPRPPPGSRPGSLRCSETERPASPAGSSLISQRRTFAVLIIMSYRRRHGDRGPAAAPGPAADRGGLPR